MSDGTTIDWKAIADDLASTGQSLNEVADHRVDCGFSGYGCQCGVYPASLAFDAAYKRWLKATHNDSETVKDSGAEPVGGEPVSVER